MKLRSFMNLVLNEHEKMYAKKSIWLSYGFLFIIVFGIGAITLSVSGSDSTTRYEYMQTCAGLMGVILMMVVVIGATNISSEFSKGTIKLLLIRPNSRWKVLLSKYIAAMIFTFEMILFLFIISFVFGLIFFGTGGSEIISVYQGTSFDLVDVNVWTYLLQSYGYGFIQLFVLVNFGLMMSSLFKTNAMAIGLTLFFYFAGEMIVGFLFLLGQEWGKYIIFANIDLSVYASGEPLYDGMSLTFSIVMIILNLILFSAVSWWSFCKRDVLS